MTHLFKKSFFCCLLLCATFAAQAQFAGGNGTEIDPYIIINTTQLNEVRNYQTAHFRLGADIDASSVWVPIGNDTPTYNDYTKRFTGTFNGNGHTITINGIGTVAVGYGSNYHVGLFGVLGDGAAVRNLRVDVSLSFAFESINAPHYIGGIAGSNHGGMINNCVVAGHISLSLLWGNGHFTSLRVGGIVGENEPTHTSPTIPTIPKIAVPQLIFQMTSREDVITSEV